MAERGLRHVERGDVVLLPPCGSPYRAVLHAVAVDGAYQTSPTVVAEVLTESLSQAAALAANTVALTAVATGYGRMSIPDFAAGLRPVISEAFPPLQRVVIGLRSPFDAEDLLAMMPELERA